MNRAIACRAGGVVFACMAFVGAGAAWGAGPLYSEGISGDLADVPVTSPVVVLSPGVNFVAQGVIIPLQPDVDFIRFIVPFQTSELIVDIDTTTNSQDSILGVTPGVGYPTPLLINDDDLDSPEDALMGHALRPVDSLVDVTAVLGSPVPANTMFTVAIARQGDAAWQGLGNMDIKLEYQLWIYAKEVPAPGTGVLGALAAVGLAARRRR